MNELTIELDQVTLSREFLAQLRQEFEAGGIWSGRFAIGGITAVPDMVFFLWHDSGEVPVSMLIRRENIETAEDLRAAARDFLAKWKKRIA